MSDQATAKTITTVKMEHERRFFPNVDMLPHGYYHSPRTFILQGYLEDDLRTRLRDERDEYGVHTYYQTRKSGEGVSREEDEIEISKEDFDSRFKDVKCSLTKTRYHFPYGDVIVEINIFHGGLDGYIQIEVEFATKELADAFVPSEWFGPEVTHDPKHGNYFLAKSAGTVFKTIV